MIFKYKAVSISPNTYMIEESTPFSKSLCYLLLGSEKALLIDTGMSLGNIRKTVDGLTSLPITVVNTHAHVDHIGSNFRFSEIYYHEDDRDVFALHTNASYVTQELLKTELPSYFLKPLSPIIKKVVTVKTGGNYHYIRDGYLFQLGGREIEVIHTPGHSVGSICLLDREARMLFSGDTICGSGILLDLEGGSSPEVYASSVARLQALSPEFDAIWPGHHYGPLKKEVLQGFQACASSIIEGTAELSFDRGRIVAAYNGIIISIVPEQAERIKKMKAMLSGETPNSR